MQGLAVGVRENICDYRKGEEAKVKRTGSRVSTTEGEVNEGGKGNGTWPPVV